MKMINVTRLCAAMIPLVAGCASQPVAVSPVGPEPASQAAYVPSGYLKVFSDTEEHVIGDGPHYYPHMGYNIYDNAGKRVEYVPNHIGNMDETPTLVRIPVGDYKVVAESSAYGRVTVPIIVQSGKTTVLHLDRGWRPASNISSTEVVRLPDGEAVGWSSALTK
jgi:hypothetical protein